MRGETYPSYKPSDVGWIGDMPAHWELKRLKYVANRSEVKVEANAEEPLPYIGLEHVESWTGRLLPLDENLVPSGVSNRFECGDTLFGKLRPYLAKACNVDFRGLCSSELLVLRGQSYNRGFLLYQLLSHGFINLVDSTTYGSKMPRASWDFIGICELPLPPLAEQQAIARFLDAKTAQIDTLVAKKRELIAKLKEKRNALIARTVTRGLPPDAATAAGLEPNPKMKDSEVPWIGKIPADWKVKRLKHISSRVTVGVVVNPSSYVSDEGVPFLLGGNIRECRIDTSACNRCSEEASSGPLVKSRLVANDLVVVRVGYPGVAAVVPPEIEGANCASMMIVGRSDKFDSQWLAYTINAKSGRDQVELVQYGAAQKQFNISHAVDFSFPFPPIAEQRAIASYLDRECARLEQLSVEVETAIARLTEYRQALITSAVTGKIDVRGWQAENEAA